MSKDGVNMFYAKVIFNSTMYNIGKTICSASTEKAVRRSLSAIISRDCGEVNIWRTGTIIGIFDTDKVTTDPASVFVIRSGNNKDRLKRKKNTVRKLDLDTYRPRVIARTIPGCEGYYKITNTKPGHTFVECLEDATIFYDKEPLSWALISLLPYFSYLRGTAVETVDTNTSKSIALGIKRKGE